MPAGKEPGFTVRVPADPTPEDLHFYPHIPAEIDSWVAAIHTQICANPPP
jgi:hypothetical protein